LNATVAADTPKATANASATEPPTKAREATTRARARSAAIITERLDRRSTSIPAIGPKASTGRTSKATVPATPAPDPVSSNTRTTRATVLKASPAREMAWP
jgi:hypothetical protein